MAGDRDNEQLNRASAARSDGGHGDGSASTLDLDMPHDAVGAYVLDALTDDERNVFEAHIRSCAACQREVAELSQVVGLLPAVVAYEHAAGIFPIPDASPDLRSRILQRITADDLPSNTAPSAVQGDGHLAEPPLTEHAPIQFPPPTQLAASRRSSGGRGATPSEAMGRIHRSWLVAAVLAILMVGAGIWGIVLQGNVDDRNNEIARLEQELALARQRANASAWQLESSGTGETHTGTLLYGLQDQTVVLVVRNMPMLPSNMVYQAWLIRGSTPEPGATFTVNDDGTGLTLVDSDAPTYDVVAITQEPTGGSESPTSPVLLQGQLSGAVGGLPSRDFAMVVLSPPE